MGGRISSSIIYSNKSSEPETEKYYPIYECFEEIESPSENNLYLSVK